MTQFFSIRSAAPVRTGLWVFMLAVFGLGLAACNQVKLPQAEDAALPGAEQAGCEAWSWLTDSVTSLQFDTQGQRLLALGPGAAVYRVAPLELVWCSGDEAASETIYLGVISPDGQWVALASYGGAEIEIRNLQDGDLVRTVAPAEPGAEEHLTNLDFSPDGRFLLGVYSQGPARLWPLHDPTAPPVVLTSKVLSSPQAAFSFKGDRLAIFDRCQMKQWNTSSLALHQVWDTDACEAAQDLVYLPAAESHPDRALLRQNASGFTIFRAQDGAVLFDWVAEDRIQPETYYPGQREHFYLEDIQPSVDGQWLAALIRYNREAYSGPGKARLPQTNYWLHILCWAPETQTWEMIYAVQVAKSSALAFSPDGQSLALEWDGTIRLYPWEDLLAALQ